MVDAEQINNDKRWMKEAMRVFTVDLQMAAKRNPALYETIFRPNAQYIQAHLNTTYRNFSTEPDSDYYRYMRLMFGKFVDMAMGIATTLKMQDAQIKQLRIVKDIANEIRSAPNIEQAKAFLNDTIKLLCNAAAIQSRA